MGKRSRYQAQKEMDGSTSDNSSKPNTPVQSDSDVDISPPAKKAKTENGATKRGPKSSADICDQFGLKDVDLEYTIADYQNLTNYGLFVRMVRPQVAAANPKIASSRMVQLMEAKWREFKESNPLVKKKKAEDAEEKEKRKERKKHKDSAKKKKKSSEKKSKKRKVISSDEDHYDDNTEEDEPPKNQAEEEPEDDEAMEEEDDKDDGDFTPKRSKHSLSGLKIRFPMLKGSGKKDKKSKHKRSNSKKAAELEDSDEGSVNSSRRSSRVATPLSRLQSDSDTGDDLERDSASEEDSRSKHRRSKSKRKSKSSKKSLQDYMSSGDEDMPSDDDTSQSSGRKRSKAKSKAKKEKQDRDYEEEEEGEDDDRLSSDEKKKKKNRRSETPVIPGERKSERSRKTISSMMTDKEFEKMMKEEAAEKKRKREAEKKKEKKEAKKSKSKAKKGYWQEDEDEKDGSGNEVSKDIDESDDHYWYCEVCKDGGDLLLCDTCPKSWHKECAKLEGEIPEGEWSCPKCKGTYVSESEEEEDHHDLYCKECKDGGDVLLCDFCKFVYHPKCVNPPLLEIPDGEWKCPRCVVGEMPLKGRIKRILFWRWSHQLSPTDELDHTQSPQKKAAAQAAEVEQKEKEAQGATPVKRPERLFFCKFEFHSYWDCEWISELQLEVHCPLQYHGLKRKWDLDEPPAMEDGSSWGRQRRKMRTEEDPHSLEERYYRYGVKPDWLQIQRIINHDKESGREGGKNTRYLVKWRDLGYEECTWEVPCELPPGLEDWDKHYKAYWEHRKEKQKGKDKDKDPKKKPKKTDLKKRWETQPDYITATGGTLHPYQLEGVNWMRFSWAQDTNIILADEMGLGKTIQAITILYTLWKEGYSKGPFLISAPLSTVPNWEREFEFWAPDMYVITYSGSKEARSVMREHEFSYDDDPFHQVAKAGRMRSSCRPKFDVCLTSYEMINVDNTCLSSLNWEVLVVDEAHRLKSQASLFFQMLSKYKIEFKLLLTGTPLQNNLEELFNLLNFLEPKTFTDMDQFLDEFSDINKDEQVRKLHEMLAPHMLRRLKLDVLTDLPTKAEFIVRIELSAMQKKFYKHILTKNYEALNVKGYANSTSLINIMMDLRKCCNHPYLFPAAEKEAPLTMNGLYEGNSLIKACGKLELLSKMLRELKKDNHRVLIFSQMTRALDILEDFLTHEGYGYERIDGSITGKLRQESIDRFNDKNRSTSFVFLLSTKAGGLGINLATADTVIIYDMDWNPHNDIQALSRAHRIGQTNRVLIYRFVSRNTVEERITEVAKKKMMLTELVIHRGMGSEKQESLSKKEVSEILRFGAEELFKDTEEGKVVWTDEAIKKLLDRTQAGENDPTETAEKEAVMGMNEYLRSFKVASYHVKEGQEENEEEEEEEKEEEKEEERDDEYWRRVLGDAYQEHRVQMLQQQEEVARTLGKGKRVRRQVNYAEVVLTKEREQMEKEAQKAKNKKSAEDAEEEEEDEVEEEAKYMSDYDYDPEGEESSEEEEAEEKEEPEEQESDPNDEDWKEKKSSTPTVPEVTEPKKRGRPPKGPKVVAELPPLLAKVNGYTEVLSFTARQRRAFLDAVMRYGMPPEEGHQSQWLVRDLRNKSEQVFRAYISLFMRHLCESVQDSAEKFSDGVPREGLSRQHVLTRIGIIALIRRKVQEFEEINGTDSMKGFKKTVTVQVTVTKPDEENAKEKGGDGKSDKGDEEQKKDGDQAKHEEKDQKPEVKDEELLKSRSEKESSEEMEVDKNNSTVKKEGVKEEGMEVDDNLHQVDGTSDNKESSGEAGNEESDKNKDKAKDNNTDIGDSKALSEEKMETDESETKGTKDGEQTKKEGAQSDSAKSEKESRRGDKEEAIEKKTENKAGEGSAKDSKDKGDSEQKEKDKGKIVVDLRKQAWELRRMFYIADGGFTELHALWQYEEQQLRPGREYETWHRRHDYWLLTGIITHGYRHWQDILNDSRFEILNRAFQSDAEKMRKAAFLNRRFQLLEQALVIEEQLRKAVLQSESLRSQLLKNCRGELDSYAELDQLAILLRQIARRGATQDPHLAKVLAQLESLVGDIKHSTNAVVPATLARAPGVMVRQGMQQMQHPQQRHQMPQQRGVPAGRAIPQALNHIVIPRHVMDQRRNTPSPNSKNTHVITLE